MYFASNSDTLPPKRWKNHGVTKGKAINTMILTTTNTRVRNVNGANINPRAITVPRSFIKHAANIPLPNSV